MTLLSSNQTNAPTTSRPSVSLLFYDKTPIFDFNYPLAIRYGLNSDTVVVESRPSVLSAKCALRG
jgi:hypothetical protein